MRPTFSIFYSWQSDRQQNHCRYLIKEALDKVAEDLNSDPQTAYHVLIDQDTLNSPGLCDIPAVILHKIAEADAVVADLTFVAETEGDSSKSCSNPNVLFELGYAFRAVGPERLICVMNEKYGLASNQIFDLAHRRHPITYTSPTVGANRHETIENLARKLRPAVVAVLEIGKTRDETAEDERQHEVDRIDLQQLFANKAYSRNRGPALFQFRFMPVRYQARFADATEVQSFVRQNGVRESDDAYPFPYPREVVPFNAGICSDFFGEPWGVSYSGQFWSEVDLNHGASQERVLDELQCRMSFAPPADKLIPAQKYIWITERIYYFGSRFAFAANVAESLPPNEIVLWSATLTGLTGQWLVIDESIRISTHYGPCQTPKLSRTTRLTAQEFADTWQELLLDFVNDFTDCFPINGDSITRAWIQERLQSQLT